MRLFARILRRPGQILAQQHARGEEIRRRGIGRDAEHFRESAASLWIVFGLDVADAEDVGGIDVGVGKPGLHFLSAGIASLGRPARYAERPRSCVDSASFGFSCLRFLQSSDGFEVVAFFVVGDPSS